MICLLEVFFDYACPYCLKGHRNLIESLPNFPDVEIIWRPCESHPRPERYGIHSDLCIQGMFFAKEHGIDLLVYHERMYDLVLHRRVNVENADILAKHVEDLLDGKAFLEALKSGKYKKMQQKANHYAFGQSGVWVVPAYRMEGQRLDSIEDVTITKKQLETFLQNSICE